MGNEIQPASISPLLSGRDVGDVSHPMLTPTPQFLEIMNLAFKMQLLFSMLMGFLSKSSSGMAGAHAHLKGKHLQLLSNHSVIHKELHQFLKKLELTLLNSLTKPLAKTADPALAEKRALPDILKGAKKILEDLALLKNSIEKPKFTSSENLESPTKEPQKESEAGKSETPTSKIDTLLKETKKTNDFLKAEANPKQAAEKLVQDLDNFIQHVQRLVGELEKHSPENVNQKGQLNELKQELQAKAKEIKDLVQPQRLANFSGALSQNGVQVLQNDIESLLLRLLQKIDVPLEKNVKNPLVKENQLVSHRSSQIPLAKGSFQSLPLNGNPSSPSGKLTFGTFDQYDSDKVGGQFNKALSTQTAPTSSTPITDQSARQPLSFVYPFSYPSSDSNRLFKFKRKDKSKRDFEEERDEEKDLSYL